MTPWWRRTDLLLILVGAAMLRLLRIAFFAPVLEGDGTEYCRLAENLVLGRGYFGMLEGAERMLPPLYPAAIALVKGVTGLETALIARLISLATSLVFLAVIFQILAERANLWAARIGASLAALSPAMVLLGSSAFAEPIQLAVFVLGVRSLLRAVDLRDKESAFYAGIGFGLAYLARVETAAVVAIASLLLATGWPRREAPSRAAWPASLTLVLGFLLAALPYPLYLRDVTGDFRFEGKSERVTATIARYIDGFRYQEANYAVDAEGREVGAWLSPNAALEGPGLVATLLKDPGATFQHVFGLLKRISWRMLSGQGLCSVLLLLAAGYVYFTRRPRALRWLDVLLFLMAGITLATGSLYKFALRYTISIVVPLYLLAPRGLVAIAESRRFTRFSTKQRSRLVLALFVVCLASLTRGFWIGHNELDEAGAAQVPLRDFGLALANEQLPDGPIMSHDPRVAYYAGRSWTPLPAAATFEGLRVHAARKNAQTVVMRDGHSTLGPWFDAKNLPPGLSLNRREGDLVLYRLALR